MYDSDKNPKIFKNAKLIKSLDISKEIQNIRTEVL